MSEQDHQQTQHEPRPGRTVVNVLAGLGGAAVLAAIFVGGYVVGNRQRAGTIPSYSAVSALGECLPNDKFAGAWVTVIYPGGAETGGFASWQSVADHPNEATLSEAFPGQPAFVKISIGCDNPNGPVSPARPWDNNNVSSEVPDTPGQSWLVQAVSGPTTLSPNGITHNGTATIRPLTDQLAPEAQP